MRNFRLLLVTALALALSVGLASGETTEGECKLKVSDPFDEDLPVIEFGEVLKGECTFYVDDDFFDKQVVCARVKLTNTSDSTAMHAQLNVAFFDEKGNLVGCTSQATMDDGVEAGGETQLGSCLIPLPREKYKEITSYTITYYEDDAPIGE